MLCPVVVAPVPAATAASEGEVHRRGSDGARVREASGVSLTRADLIRGPLAGMFPDLGRSGSSQALSLRVTVSCLRRDLSDRRAAGVVADLISWESALVLGPDERGFDRGVLSEFRGRLVGEGR